MAEEEEDFIIIVEEEESGAGSCDSLITCLLLCRRICCWNWNRLEGFSNMEILAELGHGVSGKVFRCRDRDRNDGRIVAVKQIPINRDVHKNGIPSYIYREVSNLGKLDHVNIVRLLNLVVTDHIKYVYLVFEHLDCDLHQYITNHGCQAVESMTRKKFLHQILTAVAYCHENQILHRDLKPKNLLIDQSGNTIKLADFGHSRELGGSDDQITGRMGGTRWYKAPEILFDRPYSIPVDLWSVGCIFGEMVIGKSIFPAPPHNYWLDELESIFRVLGTPTEATWPGVTTFNDYPNYGQYNPMDLPIIFAELDPDGLDLLTRLLCLDPNQRISANAALEHAYFNDLNLAIQ